jgi:hypothetical protein
MYLSQFAKDSPEVPKLAADLLKPDCAGARGLSKDEIAELKTIRRPRPVARAKAVTQSSVQSNCAFAATLVTPLPTPATPAEAEREGIRIGIRIIIIIIIRIIIRIRVVPPGVTIATTVVAKTVIGMTGIGMTVIVDIGYLV